MAATKGTATIDFTATPSDEATIVISGQAGLINTTHIEAWIQHGDTTADNGIDEHEMLEVFGRRMCKWTVDGSFELKIVLIGLLAIGTFKIHWVWSN